MTTGATPPRSPRRTSSRRKHFLHLHRFPQLHGREEIHTQIRRRKIASQTGCQETSHQKSRSRSHQSQSSPQKTSTRSQGSRKKTGQPCEEGPGTQSTCQKSSNAQGPGQKITSSSEKGSSGKSSRTQTRFCFQISLSQGQSASTQTRRNACSQGGPSCESSRAQISAPSRCRSTQTSTCRQAFRHTGHASPGTSQKISTHRSGHRHPRNRRTRTRCGPQHRFHPKTKTTPSRPPR